MTGYVALLRAVNVGGTGKLPMSTLSEMCADAGFARVRTYIASGNVVFQSPKSEDQVRAALEARLLTYAGKRVGVLVRTAVEMSGVVARNPFTDAPGNRVVALFVDGLLPQDPLDGVTGRVTERLHRGERELFIHYPEGQAETRLRIPCDRHGTGRNMNTVAKLAELAGALG